MQGKKERCCALVAISAGSWALLMTGSFSASGRSPALVVQQLARTSAIRKQKAREQTSGVVVLHFGHLKNIGMQALKNRLLICYKVILLSTQASTSHADNATAPIIPIWYTKMQKRLRIVVSTARLGILHQCSP